MQIINPYKDKEISKLTVDEIFMLWCPESTTYRTVAIRRFSMSRYIIKDTQLPNDSLGFTVSRGDRPSSDVFDTIKDIIEIFEKCNYIFRFNHIGR